MRTATIELIILRHFSASPNLIITFLLFSSKLYAPRCLLICAKKRRKKREEKRRERHAQERTTQ